MEGIISDFYISKTNLKDQNLVIMIDIKYKFYPFQRMMCVDIHL